ncbi:hypothetical protein RCH27_08555 [Paracidovorax citrulli]|uniref:hypothetical protein n=1 Tax=Paracidovorax citrulli TaxID=80869 RepID=UPI003A80149C
MATNPLIEAALRRDSESAAPPASANVTRGAAFGVFRRPETAGTRAEMMPPIAATGPRTFEPAQAQPGAGMRMDASTDPRSLTYGGGSPMPAGPYPGTGPQPRSLVQAAGIQVGAAAPQSAAPPVAQSLVEAAGIKLPGAPSASPAPAPAAAGPSNVTRVGNSYTGGPNISGDITVNGAAPGGGSTAPRSLVEAAGIVPGSAGRSNSGGVMSNPLVASALGDGASGTGVNAPLVRHSGNDWAARNELRNAQVSASSIMNNGGRWDKHKGMSPEAAYAAALGNADLAARAGQAGADVAAMRENAGLLREGLQQGGANQRSLMQYAIEQQKVNQAGEAMGYTNRTNALIEAARRQVAGEQDPTKRRSLVEYMRDVEGRAQPADPYLVVPGGQNVDPVSGKAYNTPSTVFNRQSGQFVQQPQGQGASQQFEVGQVYRDSQTGAQRRWNGKTWDRL